MIFKQKKAEPQKAPSGATVYEWLPCGFHGERATLRDEFFAFLPEEAAFLHNLPAPFAAIFRESTIALFQGMDVVMEVEHHNSVPANYHSGRREELLAQYCRWRNDPEHFFLRETITPPNKGSTFQYRVTVLTVLSSGVDCPMLDEYLYQLRTDQQCLANFTLRITGAPQGSSPATAQGRVGILHIKQRQVLSMELDHGHPALTFQVRKGKHADILLEICHNTVLRHGGIWKAYDS